MKEMMLALASYFTLPVKNEKGQGLVEYSLIIALVSIASIIALTALGPTISSVFDSINTSLGAAV
jgi:pilus assembly protein Flp/PilA